MPTEAQIKASAARRAKRKEDREKAVEQAHEQDTNFSKTLADNKGRPTEKPQPKLSRKERVKQQRAEAERKAHEQDRNLRTPVADVKSALEKNVRTGEPIPLHALNQLAKQHTAEAKDEARAIANAAGKAAFATATGLREQKRRGTRHQNMRAMQERAAVAARGKQE